MPLIFFDIDGTLLHTNGLSKAIFCDALSETFGVAVDWSYQNYGGQPDRYMAKKLLAQAGVDARQIDHARLAAAFERMGELWHQRGERAEMMVFPGVRPLLQQLEQTRDVYLAHVTANVRATAVGKMRAAGLGEASFPTGGYGDDADERAALPPLAMTRASYHYGRHFTAQECLIVGDSPADIACARANGLRVLAVATGRHRLDQLALHQPDWLLPSLADTRQVLRLLLNSS